MIAAALEAEIAEYVERNHDALDEACHRLTKQWAAGPEAFRSR